MSINDKSFQVLRYYGYNGALNNMLKEHYSLITGASSLSISDIEKEYWAFFYGSSVGSVSDIKKQALLDLGYSGSLPDLEGSYWRALFSVYQRENLLDNTLNMTIANADLSTGNVSDSSGDSDFNFFVSGIHFDAPAATSYYYKQYTFSALTGVFSALIVMDDASEPMPGALTDVNSDFGFIIDGVAVSTGYVKEDLGGGKWRVSYFPIDASYNNGYFGIEKHTTNSVKQFTTYDYRLDEL